MGKCLYEEVCIDKDCCGCDMSSSSTINNRIWDRMKYAKGSGVMYTIEDQDSDINATLLDDPYPIIMEDFTPHDAFEKMCDSMIDTYEYQLHKKAVARGCIIPGEVTNNIMQFDEEDELPL